MMTVNLRKLQGTVWFPGDDQPILVQLMSNAIPADWHYKYGSVAVEEDTLSIAGYGSIVVCQRLNGVLYVIYVLSAGQMAYEFQAVGMSIVTQKTYSDMDLAGATTAVDVSGAPFESFFGVDFDLDVQSAGAVEFGPFVKLEDGRTRWGFCEVNISGYNCAKRYVFTLTPEEFSQEVDVPGTVYPWLRIVPTQETSSQGLQDDFYLDVCHRPSEDEERYDFWFRVVSNWSQNFLACKVSIKSTMFNRARMLTGSEALVHREVDKPSLPWGYLGFHRSDHVFDNTHGGQNSDQFGRSLTSGWGDSDRGYAYSYLGGSTNFRINGTDGIIEIAANNTTYVAYNDNSENLIKDFYVRLSPEEYTVTQDAWGGVAMDVAAGGDMIMAGLTFRPDHDVYAFVRTKNSGTITLVGSEVDTNQSYLNNDPAYEFWIHVRYERDISSNARLIKIKCWHSSQNEPKAWLIEQSIASGSSPTVSTNTGLFAHAVTGNTNTKPYGVHFRSYLERGDYFMPDEPDFFDSYGHMWHTGPFRSGAMRTAQALQQTWTYDGRFDWDGSYLRIIGKIHFDGIGSNPNGLARGYAYMQMINNEAATGTADRPIPVLPYNEDNESFGFRSWDWEDGIALDPGESLWCGIPPGVGQENLVRHLFIVKPEQSNVTDPGQHWYSLPEWAVLIAARAQSGATPEVRLGNGEQLDSWHTISLSNGWTNRGGGNYPPLAYKRIKSDMILVRGHLSSGTVTGGTTIATLPAGVRPKFDEEPIASNIGNDIVVNSNGTMVIWAGSAGFYKITGVLSI
jgi:hypothetical protein